MKLLLIICIILIFLLLKKYYIFEKEKHFMMETFYYPYPAEELPITSKQTPIGCKENENHYNHHSHGTCDCPTDYYRPTANQDCTPCPPNSKRRLRSSDIGIGNCVCRTGYTMNGTTCRECNSDKELPIDGGGCSLIPRGHFIYIQDGVKKHGYCELSFYHNSDYGTPEYTFTSKDKGNSCDSRPKTTDSGRGYGAAREFVGLNSARRVKLVAKAADDSVLPSETTYQAPCQIGINTNKDDASPCPHPFESMLYVDARVSDGGFEFKKKFDSISAIKWSWKTNDNDTTRKGGCDCGDNCGEGTKATGEGCV